MKPRPVDECLAASAVIIAKTRSKLLQLQFSVDTCLTRIENSADAIAASQALLEKLKGEGPGAAYGAELASDTPPDLEQTSGGSAPRRDGAASPA
jgi:hypothetical protein